MFSTSLFATARHACEEGGHAHGFPYADGCENTLTFIGTAMSQTRRVENDCVNGLPEHMCHRGWIDR